MAQEPARGLALLDEPELAEALVDYHLYHSTRADLLRRAGRPDEAVGAYRRARDQTNNAAEQAFLDRRLRELNDGAAAAAAGGSSGPGAEDGHTLAGEIAERLFATGHGQDQ
jgi:RNA polymerase sigma-70 factor (ECF subfamily)